MVLGLRQETQHTRAACVLVVLLLHGALASWLTGLQQARPAQMVPSRMVVQIRTAQPAKPQAVAKPLPSMPHPPSHLPLHAPISKPTVPQAVSVRPLATAHSAAPVILPGTAAATSTHPVGQTAPQPTAPAESHELASTEAGFTADYLHNPAPVYPPSARRNGEEGKVLLRVHVSVSGQAETVEIQHSSGFSRLDEAAREAVANWRFTPARRGVLAIASNVIVPITFRLGH